MIDVLLAEDQEMVRAGFQMVLEAEGDISVVGAVGSGDAAVSAAERLRPDVVLMDIRMPEMNGWMPPVSSLRWRMHRAWWKRSALQRMATRWCHRRSPCVCSENSPPDH